MELILILLAVVLIGFLLARSRYSKNVDEATGTVVSTSKDLASKTGDLWRKQFAKGQYADGLRGWAATGPATNELPEDFKSWLAGLSDKEAQAFTKELFNYLSGLGYDLPKLVSGEITLAPPQRQVFVETIVVYSQAYRKAKDAQKQAEAEKGTEAPQPVESQDGKQPAEKSVSRRKSDGSETSEAPAAA
jgi:hypothetical protein